LLASSPAINRVRLNHVSLHFIIVRKVELAKHSSARHAARLAVRRVLVTPQAMLARKRFLASNSGTFPYLRLPGQHSLGDQMLLERGKRVERGARFLLHALHDHLQSLVVSNHGRKSRSTINRLAFHLIATTTISQRAKHSVNDDGGPVQKAHIALPIKLRRTTGNIHSSDRRFALSATQRAVRHSALCKALNANVVATCARTVINFYTDSKLYFQSSKLRWFVSLLNATSRLKAVSENAHVSTASLVAESANTARHFAH
jgi:hypothetical protein